MIGTNETREAPAKSSAAPRRPNWSEYMEDQFMAERRSIPVRPLPTDVSARAAASGARVQEGTRRGWAGWLGIA